jgi:MFS family permease
VGADLQGWLLSAGGIGAVVVTLLIGARSGLRRRTHLLIGGATLYGVLIAVFAITAERIGSYPLALVLILAMGASQSAYMLIIMSSLQMLVPDRLRGRVMGFFGITYAMLPLSGLLAGLASQFVGVPVAIAAGGLIVSAFALGPALLSAKIRNLGAHVAQAEAAATR